VTLIPTTNQTGWAVITLTVVAHRRCYVATSSSTFTLEVTGTPPTIPINHPPTISDIFNRAILVSTTVSIPFSVGDAETPATNLVVSATLSNTNGLSIISLDMEPNGVDRVLKIASTSCVGGGAQITVTVADGDGGTASVTFTVRAAYNASAPFITALQDQTTPFNTATPPIPFVVGDSVTAVSNLVVTATSSNTNLLPTANIVFAGTGNNRTVTLVPATNQTGSAVITITVVARPPCTVTSSTTFVLTVFPKIRLNAQSILGGGTLQLRLTGFTGQGALVQSSTDLKSWQSLYTNTAPDGQLPPLDFKTSAQPRQFFRALFSR